MRNVLRSPIKQLCWVFLLVVVFNTSLAQTRDEALVAGAIERFRVAIHPDSAELAELACEDLQYVHSSGTVRGNQLKSSRLKGVQNLNDRGKQS